MELSRTETIDGMRNEYLTFADLIAPLDTAGWQAKTRCDGFEVRDVAGHVIGLAEDVVKGVPGSRTAEEEGVDIRVLTAAEAAQRLRDAVAGLEPLAEALADETVWASPSPVEGMTLGEGVLTLWYDTFVHVDDVRAALGQSRAEGSRPQRVARLPRGGARSPRLGSGADRAHRSGRCTRDRRRRAATLPTSRSARTTSCSWRRAGPTRPRTASTPT